LLSTSSSLKVPYQSTTRQKAEEEQQVAKQQQPLGKLLYRTIHLPSFCYLYNSGEIKQISLFGFS
jgi:hypothetical protein